MICSSIYILLSWSFLLLCLFCVPFCPKFNVSQFSICCFQTHSQSSHIIKCILPVNIQNTRWPSVCSAGECYNNTCTFIWLKRKSCTQLTGSGPVIKLTRLPKSPYMFCTLHIFLCFRKPLKNQMTQMRRICRVIETLPSFKIHLFSSFT